MQETTVEKDKFVRKLKGELVGQDAIDNDLFVGDTIFYATTVGRSAELKVGRITKVTKVRENIKIQVRTVVKNYTGEWNVGGFATLSKCRYNAILWKDPPQDIVDKLDELEKKGKGE